MPMEKYIGIPNMIKSLQEGIDRKEYPKDCVERYHAILRNPKPNAAVHIGRKKRRISETKQEILLALQLTKRAMTNKEIASKIFDNGYSVGKETIRIVLVKMCKEGTLTKQRTDLPGSPYLYSIANKKAKAS